MEIEKTVSTSGPVIAEVPAGGRFKQDIERELVEGFIADDRNCVEKVIEKLYRRVFLNCLKVTRDASAAEDLSQDTFVKALKYRKSYEPKFRFINWLLKISTNLCIDFLNGKDKRESMTVCLKMFSATDCDAAEACAEIEDARAHLKIDSKVAEINFAAALETIPAECRIAFVSVHMMFLSYEEAAEMLSAPVGTVKSRVNRAKYFLAKILEKE